MADNRKSSVPGKVDQSGEYQLTVSDLNTILEANKKALSIYLEVEQQNEDILTALKEDREMLESSTNNSKAYVDNQVKLLEIMSEQNELLKEIKDKFSDFDKTLFKLNIILGSAGLGTIIMIIQAFIQHK